MKVFEMFLFGLWGYLMAWTLEVMFNYFNNVIPSMGIVIGAAIPFFYPKFFSLP